MLTKIVYGIGVMSGTSLDGVDLAYVKFNKEAQFSFEIIHAATKSYNSKWIENLLNAYQGKTDIEELNKLYGRYLGTLINEFIKEHQINTIDFIASHGHTIFHKPNENYTLQIGDGQEIANCTNYKVVSDFRTQDIALGGQGAPLVPIGDRLLFSNFDYCLNLGGFANVSYERDGDRIAFDVCPVNIVLNHFARELGMPFDSEGQSSSLGVLNFDLLSELNALKYYEMNPPKSLGLEWVESNIFPIIRKYDIHTRDILRTFTEHIAMQISQLFSEENQSVLITGGGAFNDFLLSRIKVLSKALIVVPSKEIIEYKEALIFALLGLLRIHNEINVLHSVTGAARDHSSGKIFNPNI